MKTLFHGGIKIDDKQLFGLMLKKLIFTLNMLAVANGISIIYILHQNFNLMM